VIVDTSVIVALAKSEPDAPDWAAKLENIREPVRMSAVALVEASIVLGFRDGIVSRRLDALIDEIGIEICPVTLEQAQIAREAYRDFGRGSEHRANLNFGDCFSYALAKDRREGLMYKGDDFVHTDLGPG